MCFLHNNYQFVFTSGRSAEIGKLHHHRLGYTVDGYVGVGNTGSVLLGRHTPCRLVLLQYNQTEYQQLWERPCPAGVSVGDRKEVAGESIHLCYCRTYSVALFPLNHPSSSGTVSYKLHPPMLLLLTHITPLLNMNNFIVTISLNQT